MIDTKRRRRGWVGTLLALVALVVVGFLCGALAGFLWEEPGLVVAYLSGETESVEWSEPGPVAAEPPALESVAAAPPPPAAPAAPDRPARPVEAAPPAKPTPEAKPAPVPEPAPAPAKPAVTPMRLAAATPSGFAVQVGAFGESGAAEHLAARLRERGYTSYVKAPAADGAQRWRVRVGPVPERERAEALAAKLRSGEKLPTWVLAEGEH